MGEAARLVVDDRSPTPLTHRFHVEMDPDPDALSRLLIPFAAIQVGLDSVAYVRQPAGAVARIVAMGLAPDHARHLQRRLEQVPCVRRVTLG